MSFTDRLFRVDDLVHDKDDASPGDKIFIRFEKGGDCELLATLSLSI